MVKREIADKLASLKDVIRERHKAEIIGIFGSYARGEYKEGSDADILVRFLDGATILDFVGLAEFLEEELGVKVDLVSERALKEDIKEIILSETIKV